jgi:phosphatidylserine/phosphatidylglycerophosphate/cardiolipin synthase-like enzyme
MHSKAAVVDQRWCTFGSYNLDFASLLNNLELVVEVIGDHSPRQLADHLRSDFAISPEIELKRWRQRPWSSKAYSTLAYQFRRIL